MCVGGASILIREYGEQARLSGVCRDALGRFPTESSSLCRFGCFPETS